MITEDYIKSKCIEQGFHGLASGWFRRDETREVYYVFSKGTVSVYDILPPADGDFEKFRCSKGVDFTDESELDKFIESCK